MSDIKSIAFALDPNNIPSFLLDWEVTKLCNLDCSYCPTGIEWGSHDNSTKHPDKEQCFDTIKFMFEYVDLYMQHRKPNQRKVILNVYGGESLYHPDIVEILQSVRGQYQQYRDKWHLTLVCTTNAIVGERHWEKIVPLIDNFTISYHSENLPKQKEIFKRNTLRLKELNKSFRAVIVMHNKQQYWEDCLDIIEFFKENDITHVPKALDNREPEWSYTAEQFSKLKTLWINKTPEKQKTEYSKKIIPIGVEGQVHSISEGRACCGGRRLSINSDLRSNIGFVPRQGFRDWYCSVNWFFLFVQQLTGNIYINKDCRMTAEGQVGPLGNINNTKEILDNLRQELSTGMPIIQCAKDVCRCGFCAPKAETQKEFLNLISRTTNVDIFKIK